MSLDIYLYDKESGDEVCWLNWLRNPYGLCYWAERSYEFATKTEPKQQESLWYVVNHWNYAESDLVDRTLFLQVVMKYAEAIRQLEKGYFWFDVGAFMQFIVPHVNLLPQSQYSGPDCYRIEGNVFYGRLVGLPMEYFSHPVFSLGKDKNSLEHYKAWFERLVEFAELLQDERYRFHCSN